MAGQDFFFSTAERAMKHGRSSGDIRNYSQKDACHTCKTKQNTNKTKQKTQAKQQNNTTGNGTCSRQSEKGETVRHPKRHQ